MIRTKEVPRTDIYRDVPHATQSGDADDDPKTEHGDQSNSLAQGNLNGCEVFCRPKEDQD
jgi:hypothetical protein